MGVLDLVNEVVESETEMLQRRINNLQFALIELITHLEIGDPAHNDYMIQNARSVLEGEFED